MKIVKIIERPTSPTDEGEWVVFCQLLVGNAYQYGALIYATQEEAREAKEGDNVDTERIRFRRRTNNTQI